MEVYIRSSTTETLYVLTDLLEELGYVSGIGLGYGLDDRGFESRHGLGIFLFTTSSTPGLGPTQPPIQWVPRALSLGVKWPGREVDHSPSSSAVVNNAWRYTSTPPYTFMEWCSVKKHRDNFTFSFTLLYDELFHLLSETEDA
jgi:hypothetical protein